MQFSVIQGDITDRSADVPVNAAGTSLRMGSGVARSLRRGARIICSEIDAVRPKSLADVRFIASGEREVETGRDVAEDARSES